MQAMPRPAPRVAPATIATLPLSTTSRKYKRFVRQDIDLGGVRLKRGDQIMASLAAANMDPAANAMPETLDLARRPNHHIAFGTGIHFCLGHQLARLEGKCALEALYTRWPKLDLAIQPEQIRWRSRPGIRAITSLPVVATRSDG